MPIHVKPSFAAQEGERQGTLYLVATPIGNLEDMTMRAVRILREVDVIAAEDTRQTRKLLAHFSISNRLVSYHEHNKQASGQELVRMLVEGQSIALVSDAGTPAVSDPGYELVQAAIAADVAVVPIPGANAALSALIVSGLPTSSFTYVGFLPKQKKQLEQRLEQLKPMDSTIILYESPHRLVRTLESLYATWGDRQAALTRELTKKYEEVARGTLSECIEWVKAHEPRGEYCVVVAGRSPGDGADSGSADERWWQALTIAEHVEHYAVVQGLDRKEAMKRTAKDRGVSKRDIYNTLHHA